jgi:hypothetical protein
MYLECIELLWVRWTVTESNVDEKECTTTEQEAERRRKCKILVLLNLLLKFSRLLSFPVFLYLRWKRDAISSSFSSVSFFLSLTTTTHFLSWNCLSERSLWVNIWFDSDSHACKSFCFFFFWSSSQKLSRSLSRQNKWRKEYYRQEIQDQERPFLVYLLIEWPEGSNQRSSCVSLAQILLRNKESSDSEWRKKSVTKNNVSNDTSFRFTSSETRREMKTTQRFRRRSKTHIHSLSRQQMILSLHSHPFLPESSSSHFVSGHCFRWTCLPFSWSYSSAMHLHCPRIRFLSRTWEGSAFNWVFLSCLCYTSFFSCLESVFVYLRCDSRDRFRKETMMALLDQETNNLVKTKK